MCASKQARRIGSIKNLYRILDKKERVDERYIGALEKELANNIKRFCEDIDPINQKEKERNPDFVPEGERRQKLEQHQVLGDPVALHDRQQGRK